MLLTKKEWVEQKEQEILSRISPDKATRKLYKKVFGREINLKHPRYFCEKLHYLKLNDYYNNPLVTTCIDKYSVKEYMTCMGKKELCPQLYGVYDHPSKIEWGTLPRQFVLKCTHGCDYNIICRDKNTFDFAAAARQLNLWLKEDYWIKFAETQYRFVRKRIIAEEYLGNDLVTYRFCCFNGVPKFIYVMEEEPGKNCIDYFDITWNKLNYEWEGRVSFPSPLKKPDNLIQMLEIAGELSRGFPFVRIDLYDVEGKIYLSEFTFIPAGGTMKFKNRNIARKLGEWIDIR